MTTKSVLILPGLNQLYYVNKCLNYFDLEKNIRNYFSKFEIHFKTSQNENFHLVRLNMNELECIIDLGDKVSLIPGDMKKSLELILS